METPTANSVRDKWKAQKEQELANCEKQINAIKDIINEAISNAKEGEEIKGFVNIPYNFPTTVAEEALVSHYSSHGWNLDLEILSTLHWEITMKKPGYSLEEEYKMRPR